MRRGAVAEWSRPFCLVISKFWPQIRPFFDLQLKFCHMLTDAGHHLLYNVQVRSYDMTFQIQSGSLSSMLPNQLNPLIVPVQSQTRHLHLLSQHQRLKALLLCFHSVKYSIQRLRTTHFKLYAVPLNLGHDPVFCHLMRP